MPQCLAKIPPPNPRPLRCCWVKIIIIGIDLYNHVFLEYEMDKDNGGLIDAANATKLHVIGVGQVILFLVFLLLIVDFSRYIGFF